MGTIGNGYRVMSARIYRHKGLMPLWGWIIRAEYISPADNLPGTCTIRSEGYYLSPEEAAAGLIAVYDEPGT